MRLDTDEPSNYGITTSFSTEHFGDCLELMPLIQDGCIDMILCDLPYGSTACKWDAVIDLNRMWAEFERIIRPRGAIALFGSEPFSSYLRTSNIKNYKYDWVWNKVTARGHLVSKVRPLQQTETISVFGYGAIDYYPQMVKRPMHSIATSREYARTEIVGGGAQRAEAVKTKTYDTWYPKNLLTFPSVNGGKHPTQKPVPLLRYLIETYTLPNQIVLDCTAGVFSTAVACIDAGRKYVVIEKDREFYNLGLRRIISHKQKPTIFQWMNP